MNSFNLKLLSAVLSTSAGAVFAANVSNVDLVAKANNNFGIDLFKEVQSKQKGRNVFLSPLSASLALSMLYNGAEGKTQEEIGSALAFKNLSVEDVNEGNAEIMKDLEDSSKGFSLNIANSMWVKQDFLIKPSFEQVIEKSYAASVKNLDFTSTTASATINQWVNDKTAGKISKIVPDQLPSSARLFLINATYFKADWTVPFKADSTEPAPFEGSSSKVATMNAKGTMQYVKQDGVEAIDLSYGPEAKASLIAILPGEGTSLDEYINKLSDKNLQKVVKSVSAVRPRYGHLAMPKFKLDYSASLNDTLKVLGMKLAFSDGADLSAISNQSLNVSSVEQKTYVAVDEKGTEAAAVTSIGIGATAVVVRPPLGFDMNINRPFLFLIRDNVRGAILFIGAITQP